VGEKRGSGGEVSDNRNLCRDRPMASLGKGKMRTKIERGQCMSHKGAWGEKNRPTAEFG